VIRFISAYAIVLLMACLPMSVHADYVINATDTGNYAKNGGGFFGSPESIQARTGIYAAGVQDYTGFGFVAIETRNYFEFNLAQVAGQITGVTLQLFEPVGGFLALNHNVPFGGSASYTLRDASQDAGNLAENGGLILGEAGYSAYLSRYNNLGSGTLFGGTTVTSTNDGTILSIALNSSAIAAILAHEGGMFAIGGAVDPSALPNNFSFVGIFNGSNSVGISRLVIQTSQSVPEPGSLALVGIGGLVFLGHARYRKARVA
jgi:hypothetical protein